MSTSTNSYEDCSKFLEQKAEPNGTSYHYTNWLGLKGILETRQLWLTEYRHLNDSSEVRYAIKIIRDYVLHKESNENFKLFFEAAFNSLDEIIGDRDFFICSFCSEPNYLYAWRSYANDGSGFSIGFKKEFFKSTSEPISLSVSPDFHRGKVYYGKNKDKNKKIFEGIDKIMNAVKLDLSEKNVFLKTNPTRETQIIVMRFWVHLLPYLTLIKHEAYEGEHEYRIHVSKNKACDLQRLFTPGENKEAPHLDSKKRVYFDFDLKNISEIWVGPRLNFEHAKSDIMSILNSLKGKGHEIDSIEIVPSNIPYRNIFY